MTLTTDEILSWQPDKFSEDHVDNLLLQILLESKKWNLVYYNPPSGSWKSINFRRGETEFRQVGPKRGRGQLRRPDIAFQQMIGNESKLNLFLVESKQRLSSWRDKAPSEMKAYFEKVIRQVPIRHKRRVSTKDWEEIAATDIDASWIQRADLSYCFGFAYSIGALKYSELSGEKIRNKIYTKIQAVDSNIPVMICAVGWRLPNYDPIVIGEFTKSFSDEVRKDLVFILDQYGGAKLEQVS